MDRRTRHPKRGFPRRPTYGRRRRGLVDMGSYRMIPLNEGPALADDVLEGAVENITRKRPDLLEIFERDGLLLANMPADHPKRGEQREMYVSHGARLAWEDEWDHPVAGRVVSMAFDPAPLTGSQFMEKVTGVKVPP